MKIVPMLCGALLWSAVASARPLIFEPASFFPDTAEFIGLTGNEALLTNSFYAQPDPDLPEEVTQVVKLYRRGSNGQWTYVRDIISERSAYNQNEGYNLEVQGSVAAVVLPSGLHIFERTSAGWVEASLDIPRPQSSVVAVDSNRVLAIETGAGVCAPEAVLLERGTNGHWNISAHLPAPAGACVSSVALDASAAALLSRPASQTQGSNSTAMRIFERSGSAWIQAAQFAGTESGTQHYGPVLDIHSGLALVSGTEKGMHIYRRGGSGWTESDPLKFPDAYGNAGQFASAIEITDAYVLAAGYNTNRRAEAVYLFRNEPANAFPHVALLTVASSERIL